MTGDPEFDRKFVVKGDNESEIRVILDPSIRQKIMLIKNFNLEINTNNSNVAYYVDFHSISATKQEAARLRLILDTLIDIVEKIETYSPPV